MTEQKGGLSRLTRMKAGKRTPKIVDFPGLEGERVGLVVLTESEIEEARLGTWEYLVKKKGIDPDSVRGAILYDREFWNRALLKALVDPDSGALLTPLASSVEDLKRNLTADERAALIRELADHQDSCNPDLDTEAGRLAAEELLQELQKKGQSRAAMEQLLNGTVPSTLRRSLLTLALQRQSSRPDKSSPT